MSESKADTSAPVCVTGASGFLASELVKQLLERGYTVHGTVRSLKNPDKVDHLKKLKGADERLKLFEADLLKEESFKEPVKGCSCVFHTASPFYMENIEDPEKEMYAPAVQGTLSVLRAANEEASVSRVVLTSSTASMYFDNRPPSHYYSEEDWSDMAFMEKFGLYYPISKTRAEKAAWEFIEALPKERGLTMCTVNPTLIIGPKLQPGLNQSHGWVLNVMQSENVPNQGKSFVDVRDVALLHIKCWENKEASGRHLMMAQTLSWTAFAKIARTTPGLPDGLIKVQGLLEGDFQPGPLGSQEKAKNLGVHYLPIEDTIRETIKSLIEHKHFKQ